MNEFHWERRIAIISQMKISCAYVTYRFGQKFQDQNYTCICEHQRVSIKSTMLKNDMPQTSFNLVSFK